MIMPRIPATHRQTIRRLNNNKLRDLKKMIATSFAAFTTMLAFLAVLNSDLTLQTSLSTIAFQQDNQAAHVPVPQELSRLPSKVDAPRGSTPSNEVMTDISFELGRGDNLLGALTSTGVSKANALDAVRALKKIFDPRNLRSGQVFTLGARPDGDGNLGLERLEFVPETDLKISVVRKTSGTYAVRSEPVSHSSRLVVKSGVVGSSFYEAANKAKVPKPVTLDTFATLGFAIDFQRDIRNGDQFEILFEMFDDGREQGTHAGRPIYMALGLRDRQVAVYRFTTTDGNTAYYNEAGVALGTTLIKTPMNGARLSSHFGKRKHPVLGYTRMHRGLDFAAPKGTPVLAAGDGVVLEVGAKGSFGNYVRIKHDSSYSTAYAHLNRYAKNIRSGVSVSQGQVIGYVGMTGLTTGPNLHYEVLHKGRQINPRRLKLTPRHTLKGTELARFERYKDKVRSLLTRHEARRADFGAPVVDGPVL